MSKCLANDLKLDLSRVDPDFEAGNGYQSFRSQTRGQMGFNNNNRGGAGEINNESREMMMPVDQNYYYDAYYDG